LTQISSTDVPQGGVDGVASLEELLDQPQADEASAASDAHPHSITVVPLLHCSRLYKTPRAAANRKKGVNLDLQRRI
jgi:hypothetical protein